MLRLLFLCAVTLVATANDCWWTGCQRDSWKTVGCAQYYRVETDKRPCEDGHEYLCCTRNGDNSIRRGGTSVDTCRWTDCQKNDWKVRGCEINNMTQMNVRSCDNGQEFYCCTKSSSTNP